MANKGKTPGILLRNAGIFNPVLVQAVGLCPVVAMATSVKSAALLAAVATVIITLSELIASLFLKPIPRWVRIGIYIILGGAMVSPLMILIERFNTTLFGELGIYLPIMAVNSLIVLRCERFAVKIRPVAALTDGLTASVGYAAVLLAVGTMREIFGKGSILGFAFFKGHTMTGLLLPFGGFIMLGFFGAALRVIITKFWPRYLDKKQPKPGAKKKVIHKPESKPVTVTEQITVVPEFTADDTTFSLDELDETAEETADNSTSPPEEETEQETAAEEIAPVETPVEQPTSDEAAEPDIQPEEPAETKEEKDNFKELTIADLNTYSAPSVTEQSGSDDELEMLMNRSISDILTKHEKEDVKQ